MEFLDFDWKETLVLAVLLALMSWPAHAQKVKQAMRVCSYRVDSGLALPDPACTPGVIDPRIEALSNGQHVYPINGPKIELNICASDFRTPPFRQATKSTHEKKLVCAAYGIEHGCPGPGYELDDICSVETGCKNVPANLWPQPIKEAILKDHQVEDKLPKLICAGKISLKDAQECLIGDWVKCAEKVKALEQAGEK